MLHPDGVRVHRIRQRRLTRHQTSGNGRASRASAGVHQPVGTAASGRGIKLGGVMLREAALPYPVNTYGVLMFRRRSLRRLAASLPPGLGLLLQRIDFGGELGLLRRQLL